MEELGFRKLRQLGGGCFENWLPDSLLGTSTTVTSTVGLLDHQPGSERAIARDEAISAMVEKNAVEVVHQTSPGFYSRIFVVPKATGGWRPVIDLSPLNLYVDKTSVKMETP